MLPPEMYSVDLERRVIESLGDRAYATIYCSANRGGCGKFSEEATFGSRQSCPKCGGKLSVDTPQGRNAPLTRLLEPYAQSLIARAISESRVLDGPYYVKPNVVCEELELTSGSGADLAILDKQVRGVPPAENIKCVIEVKMSLLWNWEPERRDPVGDYDDHQGRPSIDRTDTILKAAGKAAIIRGTDAGRTIPYVVIANSPPPSGYYGKIDATVQGGFVQKWLSVTPEPIWLNKAKAKGGKDRNPTQTPKGGFVRLNTLSELIETVEWLLDTDWHFLGGMCDPETLGKLISDIPPGLSLRDVGKTFLDGLENIQSGG